MDLSSFRTAAKYLNLGIMLALAVFICAAGGYLLDGAFGFEEHWLFLAGVLLGFIAGLYHLVKELSRVEKERDSDDKSGGAKSGGGPVEDGK